VEQLHPEWVHPEWAPKEARLFEKAGLLNFAAQRCANAPRSGLWKATASR